MKLPFMRKKKSFTLGITPAWAQPVGLERAALEKVDPVVPAGGEVAGVFHIHGIIIFRGKDGHEPCHHIRKVRLPQEL